MGEEGKQEGRKEGREKRVKEGGREMGMQALLGEGNQKRRKQTRI